MKGRITEEQESYSDIFHGKEFVFFLLLSKFLREVLHYFVLVRILLELGMKLKCYSEFLSRNFGLFRLVKSRIE